VPANNQSIAVVAYGQGFSWLVGSDEILFSPVLGELCAITRAAHARTGSTAGRFMATVKDLSKAVDERRKRDRR
jgi:hypothetical protein